jgi:hypothetical protein
LIGLTTIIPDTLVWQDGMQDWMAASQHFSFADAPSAVNQRGFLHDALSGGERRASEMNASAPPRTFGEAIKVCISKYVYFSGRASRSEFWYFILYS